MSEATSPVWEQRREVTNRGDVRRQALLTALADLIAEGETLESIAVAQVTERAGVTRSGFYFYFPNLALAVGALAEGLYDDAHAANELLADTSVEPGLRIRKALTRLFDGVDQGRQTYLAALGARSAEPSLQAFWDATRADFARPIGEVITAERAAGRAPEGADADALARTLVELNDRCLELYATDSTPDREQQIEVLVTIWLRSIYATP